MSPEIKQKLKKILEKILETKKLSLFVAIKKEDDNLWDLVIGGENLDNQDNLQEIIKIINKELNKNEVILFARLVLLNSNDFFVKNFNLAFGAESGSDMEIYNSQINNIMIKQACLFYSK